MWYHKVFEEPFLSSGGTSTGADVAMCVCFRKNWVRDCGDRLVPSSTIQVYSDKATVQVYSNNTNS
jgi:4-diphosphocytidyl-2C-methyl-D-erythritol kinase